MDGKPAVEDDPDAILEFTKKKKKKKSVNLDELIASQETPKQENEEKPNDEEDLDELNILKAKKKKKKKKFTMDEGDQEQKTVPVKHESGESGDELMTVAQEEETETEILSKKKKKKPKEVTFVDDDVADLESKDDVDIHVTPGQSSWLGTDRDYTYDELLDRVFDIMMKKNPEMIAGEKKRFVMKPPQCARVGTRKTSFINFTDICSVLHRQPKHCLSFILAELGTSGSIDGNNQLIIKGRFQQKQLESVLRRYIKEYVTCHTCKSPDTVLERKDRLYFLRCNVCQSRCSVASIKSGFQAVTNKRARLRAKAA